MIKSEATLRTSIQTRVELLIWETVIQTVDLGNKLRTALKKHPLSAPGIRNLPAIQSLILAVILVMGAASGLIAGAALAYLSLYR